MRLNAKQIAAYTGGQFLVDPIDPSALMTGITWDSREIEPGWLYVALPGERVDGHDFVEAVLVAGAAGALVMQSPGDRALLLAREMGAAIIEVASTYSAVTDLAREWRGHLGGKVVAVTGSTGKTTTKNLVRDVAAAHGSVTATRGNQNNELGVPRTLLAANPETATVVVEMGMRGLGQIASLCDFVRPDWGLVTNVGESHIELLGSREAIAQAKSELFCALPPGTGRAFVNEDDPFGPWCAERAELACRHVAVTGFGGPGPASPADLTVDPCGADSRVWAEDVVLDDEGRPRFTLCATGFGVHGGAADVFEIRRVPCALALRGIHNVSNACAAAAVGCALGCTLDECADALASSLPESGRQEVLRAPDGFLVVNDAYNANPDSMRASLHAFAAMAVPGRRIAVLGDMGELGEFSRACHLGVGKEVASLPIDEILCVGEWSRYIAEGAERQGMDADRIVRLSTVADVLENLEDRLGPDDAVLVKASHFMGLDRVAEGLVS